MLTLTENAGVVVKNLADRTVGPAEGGLRISSAATADNFEVAVAPRPEPRDQVVESGGARIYLEPDAATALDGKVLDAQIDEAGAVRFSLGDQR
jgi:Fe-S cluster assembly iron-binding protein IscA